jgi:DNA-binding transcriptional LysR family regulator
MIDSRQLRCFLAVAHELHFTRAADQLQIAQSALSRHVNELEHRLGVRLLNRGRRSAITLTEAGRTLFAEAEQAVRQLDRAAAMARRAGRGEIGRIEIGYVVSAALSGILPQTLEHFRQVRPDIHVELVALDTPRQLDTLHSGALDIGFLRPRATYPSGVTATIIHREPMLLAVAADHPLATGQVDPAALSKENFILPQFDESEGFAEHLRALASLGGFEPRPTHRVRDFVTAATMAGAGYGVVLAPSSMASISLRNVVCRRIEGYEGFAELAIACRTTSLSPAVQAFLGTTVRLHAGAAS